MPSSRYSADTDVSRYAHRGLGQPHLSLRQREPSSRRCGQGGPRPAPGSDNADYVNLLPGCCRWSLVAPARRLPRRVRARPGATWRPSSCPKGAGYGGTGGGGVWCAGDFHGWVAAPRLPVSTRPAAVTVALSAQVVDGFAWATSPRTVHRPCPTAPAWRVVRPAWTAGPAAPTRRGRARGVTRLDFNAAAERGPCGAGRVGGKVRRPPELDRARPGGVGSLGVERGCRYRPTGARTPDPHANSSSACEPRRTNSRVVASGFW